jgi:hypothetical protein
MPGQSSLLADRHGRFLSIAGILPITSSLPIPANILVADHPRDCLVHALKQ